MMDTVIIMKEKTGREKRKDIIKTIRIADTVKGIAAVIVTVRSVGMEEDMIPVMTEEMIVVIIPAM